MTDSNQNTSPLEEKVPEFTEFEVKFRVESHLLVQFKQIVDSLEGEKKFIYVEGPDFYYIKQGLADGFARYRKPSYGLDGGRSEMTVKFKPKGAKNSIIRKEINIRVDNTPDSAVKEFIEAMDFKFNFSIHKNCQIYILDDATLVFYTVYDTTDGTPKNQDSFVEIEVSEEKIATMTEPEAWAVIEKYEKILSPLGITAKKRLRKSLFEMYVREPK